MKFKYYIIEDTGAVTGTNDKATADELAEGSGWACVLAVIDVENNTDLVMGAVGETPEIEQQLIRTEG